MSPIYPVIPIKVNGKREFLVLKPNQPRPPSPEPLRAAWAARPVRQTFPLATVVEGHDYSEKYPLGVCGLQNSNNMCYLNSVLQALLHLPPVMALLDRIRRSSALHTNPDLLVLDGLVQFAADYEAKIGFAAPGPGGRAAAPAVTSAERFYNIITSHRNFRHLQRGRQEDAQEFLGYLLETLEETFAKAIAADPPRAPAEEEKVSEWTQVGKHSKPIVERKAGLEVASSNPIAKLFGGRVRNLFVQRGQNPSITLDPCQEVLLEISPASVKSVQDAIDHLMAPEEIVVEKKGKPVTAVKRMEFVRTPPVLIMFFKRFTFYCREDGQYDLGKILKPITISPVRIPLGEGTTAQYQPTAIVYHHGPSATAGHYTTEVLKENKWYTIDDDYVSCSSTKSSGMTAYMAFYERI